MSARSSDSVGRKVNVKMVASIADHSTIRRKAIHGTPGWKYCRDVQSSSANGDAAAPLMVCQARRAIAREVFQNQPMSTTMTRTVPAQKNQTERPASHQLMRSAVRKPPRPDRNGMV